MEEIEISEKRSEQEEETYFGWLRDYNHQENEPFWRSLEEGAEREFSLVARSPAGEVIGGVCGKALHQWLQVNIMAVAPEHRGNGVGTALMKAAEEFGLREGCKFAYVDTLSYQAPDFYLRLGYREAGRLPNWDSHGHDKLFFMKELG